MEHIRVWEFTDRKSGETRRFEQVELTIDGEMQLLRFVTEAAGRLREADFPFDRVGNIWPDPNDLARIDISLVTEMLTVVATEAADLLTRGAAVLLSLWEFDENRRRIATFTDDLAFLRRNLHTADVVEMVETFMEQNDIERLRRPFSRALNLMPTMPQVTPETTTGPSIFSPPPDTAAQPASDGRAPGQPSMGI